MNKTIKLELLRKICMWYDGFGVYKYFETKFEGAGVFCEILEYLLDNNQITQNEYSDMLIDTDKEYITTELPKDLDKQEDFVRDKRRELGI